LDSLTTAEPFRELNYSIHYNWKEVDCETGKHTNRT